MSFQPPPGPPPPPPPPSGGWQPPPQGYGSPPPPPPYGGQPPVAVGTPSPWGPPPPPAKPPRRKLFIGLGIGGAVLLLLIVVAAATVANRVSGGVSLSDLHRGDCFNTAKKLIAERADRVGCAEPHTDEVAGVLAFPGGSGASYPGQQGILDFGRSDCLQQVQEFFGAKSIQPTMQVFVFGPDKAAWGKGERTVVCSLREPSADQRKGSYLDG